MKFQDIKGINLSKLAMPCPFSEDLRCRAIWMKEMLGYQVDAVTAALRMPPRTIDRYVSCIMSQKFTISEK